MQKIAIITGATGGIGKEFLKEFIQRKDLEQIWVIGSNKERLEKIKEEYGESIIPIVCDLTNKNDVEMLIEKIIESDIDIRYLVNSAGLAKFCRYNEIEMQEISRIIDINCKNLILLCHACIKHMNKNSRILNISSAAAFQPNPYLALYSATKVFVKNYSRALNFELKDTGITCTAVCPGWVDTGMLDKKRNGKKIKFPGLVSAQKVVKKAIKDADKGKDMSVCTMYVKYEHLLSKILPNSIIMKIWAKGVEKYF